MAIVKRVKADGKPSYLVRVASVDPLSGRRTNINLGTFPNRKAAEAAERVGMVNRDKGTLLQPETTTVAELLTDWLKAKSAEIGTQSMVDYEISVRKHLVPALGTVKVQALTAQRIDAQYRSWRDAGMSARVIRGNHLRLNQALDRAVQFNLIAANPCKSVTPPRVEPSPHGVWDAGQITRFLAYAEQEDGLHPLWHLLAIEGFRRGEALGLRWQDIDLEKGVARIVQQVQADKANGGAARIIPRTKTQAGVRAVALTAETLTVLRAHRKAWLARQVAAASWADYDLVICTRTGEPINPNRLTKQFDRMIKSLGLPRIRVHDLRHSAATMLLQAGVPIKVASERLGHAKVSTTLDIYAHVLPHMQGEAAAALSRVLSAAGVTQTGVNA